MAAPFGARPLSFAINKTAPFAGRGFISAYSRGARYRAAARYSGSALARFKTRVAFVDHVYAALTAYDNAVLIAVFRGFERVPDLHSVHPKKKHTGPQMSPRPRNIRGFPSPVNLWGGLFGVFSKTGVTRYSAFGIKAHPHAGPPAFFTLDFKPAGKGSKVRPPPARLDHRAPTRHAGVRRRLPEHRLQAPKLQARRADRPGAPRHRPYRPYAPAP